MSRTNRSRLRIAAKVLMGLVIILWLWFGVCSAASEGPGWVNWLMHILVPAGLFVIGTLATFRWLGIRSALLTIEGTLATAFVLRNLGGSRSDAVTTALMLASLVFPPLAAGIMFLVCLPRPRLARERLT